MNLSLAGNQDPRREVGSASFSKCGRYRFALSRRWDHHRGVLGWLMMNPSTAGPIDDDATIRRVRGFTEAFGYGGFIVVNTTAFIVTDSSQLPKTAAALLDHPDNAFYQHRATDQAEAMVMAFGVPIKGREQLARESWDRMQLAPLNCYALDVTKDGWPRHPLRLPGNLTLKRWEWPE